MLITFKYSKPQPGKKDNGGWEEERARVKGGEQGEWGGGEGGGWRVSGIVNTLKVN